MSALRFAQIALAVSDIDRSERFYADDLGLLKLSRDGNHALFDCQPVMLMLDGTQKTAVPTAGVCHFFQVDQIHRAVERLKAKNVQFDDEPRVVSQSPQHDLWMAFFRDPDDHLLALMEERCKSPSSRVAMRKHLMV